MSLFDEKKCAEIISRINKLTLQARRGANQAAGSGRLDFQQTH
jgi:hypothetical protein